jgi:hypothetical protein
MCTFSFGVEIEVIAEPRELFIPAWTASQYYAQLADCLRDKDLNAVADPLCDGHRKHPEHYDKWFITKDGSLGRPTYPLRKPKLSHLWLAITFKHFIFTSHSV